GISLDGQGRLYVADTGNGRIRQLTFGPAPAPNGPKIDPNRIVNSASLSGPLPAGGWGTVFGQNFTGGTARSGTANDVSGSLLPTSLDGVGVTVNDVPAAVSYISQSQINFQVPTGLPTGGVAVKVTTPAGTSVAAGGYAQVSPALFNLTQVQAQT